VQTPVAIVDANIERCPARTRAATRAAAEAFIDYLFTPAAQAEFEAVGFRRACPNPSPDCPEAVGFRRPPASRSPPRHAAVPGTIAAPRHKPSHSPAPGQQVCGNAGHPGLGGCFRECACTDRQWNALGASLTFIAFIIALP